jgi:hypothetical protein
MDDYSKYYYQRIGSDKGDFGDISSRLQIRKDLQCKSFQWYLDTIFPELVSRIMKIGIHRKLIKKNPSSSSRAMPLRKER